MNNFDTDLVFTKEAIKDIFSLSNAEQAKKLFERILIALEQEVDYYSLPSVAEKVDFVRIKHVSKDTKTMTYIVKTNERTVTCVSYIGDVFVKE